jgi:type II secretory pathway component HofQ
VDPERASLGEPIDLRLHDADLVETLRTFARIADLNLLVAPGVEGKIHAEFNQLPWDLALDAILRTEDLAVAHWEGLVFVFPARRAPPAFQALPPPWGDGKPLPSARQLPVVELLEELVAPGVKKQDSPQDIATPERWGEPVDLSLKGVDLYKTLRLFSRIGDFELLLDGDVTGSLSCELRGVPWDKAFVAILALHDLPFEEARNPLTGRQILRIRRRTPEAPP